MPSELASEAGEGAFMDAPHPAFRSAQRRPLPAKRGEVRKARTRGEEITNPVAGAGARAEIAPRPEEAALIVLLDA